MVGNVFSKVIQVSLNNIMKTIISRIFPKINRKLKTNSGYKQMRFMIMFRAAVCFMFLIKLKWPKSKNIPEITTTSPQSKLVRFSLGFKKGIPHDDGMY